MSLTASIESGHVLVVASLSAKKCIEAIQKPPYHREKFAQLWRRMTAFEAGLPGLRKRLRSRSASMHFTPPRLVIRALGSSRIEINGKPVSAPEWQNQKKVREFVARHTIRKFHAIRGDLGGICHQILPESGYVRPGAVVVGTDSHTTSHGALGAFAFGIGATEMASVWTLGPIVL